MSTLQANNVTNVAGSALPDNLLPVTASVWVQFTSGAVINDSHNVSSITDSGVGLFDINFTTNLANINYSTVYTNAGGSTLVFSTAGTEAVGSVRCEQRNSSSGALQDSALTNCQIFGGQ